MRLRRNRGAGRHADVDPARELQAADTAAGAGAGDVSGAVAVSRAVLMTRVVMVGLWLLILAGPVLGGLALATRAAPATDAERAPAQDDGPRQVSGSGAGEFASRFVAAWLGASQGDEQALARFVTEVPELPSDPVLRSAGALRVADTTRLAAGSWSVTVAGEVELATSQDGDEWSDPVTKFWRVGVHAEFTDTDAGPEGRAYVATSLPAEVAGPDRAQAGDLAYGPTVDGAPGRLGEAVASFLSLYLTGGSDVERYVAPDSRLPHPRDTGYEDVEVVSMAAATPAGEAVDLRELQRRELPRDGRRMEVLATVQPNTEVGSVSAQQYVLELVARAGRWEVAGLEPAVSLQGESTRQPDHGGSDGTGGE